MLDSNEGSTTETRIPEEPLKQLLEGYEKREDLLGSNGLPSNLQKAVIECALELALTAQQGYNTGCRKRFSSGWPGDLTPLFRGADWNESRAGAKVLPDCREELAGAGGPVMRSVAKTRIRTLTVLTAVVAALALPPLVPAQGQRRVSSSLLLPIDASGSMGDAIGAGNAEVKIAAAKRAATAALSRAAGGGSVEVRWRWWPSAATAPTRCRATRTSPATLTG